MPFQAFLHQLASTNDLSPSDFVLEITESALVDTSPGTLSALNALVASGFQLAIDDFGTGFSSLQQLQYLPAKTIKIDRSFVSEIESNPSLRAIIESTVLLSERLGSKTVAEGVETEDQFSVLKSYGCDYFQGYLFAKPMSGSDFLSFCSSHSTTTGSS